MLEELTVGECLELLRSRELGRVGFCVGDDPTILPVNYRVIANGVVFRTAPGAKLAAALVHARVAFEVDDVDVEEARGWSVLVVGTATELRDGASREQAESLGVLSRAPGSKEHFVVVPTEQVTGRRFSPD